MTASPPDTSETISRELRNACAARLDRLREYFSEQAVDALLVTNPTEIHYLTGFSGHDSLLLVDGDSSMIISDCRYDEALNPWKVVTFTSVGMGIQHRLFEAVAEQCRQRRINRLGLQGDHVTLTARETYTNELPGVEVVATSGLISQLRMCKDDLEVAAIQRAIALHQQALEATLPCIVVGMREIEVAARLEYEMKIRGASGPSFGTMVKAGPGSSVIHAETGEAKIEADQPLLIDFGAIVDGYCSDMTRTFAINTFPEKIREIYNIVLDAQQAAIDACKPGKTCAEVDSVARDMIDNAGYGDSFGHGLGHGLGLDIHEDPYFNQLSTDVVLKPGMVMTVEPGIYLPGVGGVRIEDDVLITDTGHRVLTSFPKSIDTAIVQAQEKTVANTSNRPFQGANA